MPHLVNFGGFIANRLRLVRSAHLALVFGRYGREMRSVRFILRPLSARAALFSEFFGDPEKNA